MQVRAGRAAGGAHLPNDLPSSYELTFHHGNLRQMEVHRMEAQPVIDKDSFAREEVVDGQPDNPIVGRKHVGWYGTYAQSSVLRAASGPVPSNGKVVNE